MSEANRVDISLIEEVIAGVTPQNPTFKKIPFTSAGDFSFTPITAESTEIRSDRQKDDLPVVGQEVGGSLDLELSYGKYDDLIAGAFYNNWKMLGTISEGSVTGIANLVLTIVGGIPDAIEDNALILLTNTQNNNSVLRVVDSVTQNTITLNLALGDGFPAATLKIELVGVSITTGSFTHTPLAKTLSYDNQEATAVIQASNLEAGDWLVVHSLGYFRVLSVATLNNETIITYDQTISITEDEEYSIDEPAGTKYTYFSNSIKNGVLKKTYSILQRFESLQGDNQLIYSGLSVDTLSLSLDAQSIITANVALLGLNGSYLSNLIPEAQIVENVLEGILTSSSGVRKVLLGGLEVNGPNWVQSSTFELSNNSRRQLAVGQISSVGIAPGTSVITGVLSTYFGNNDLARAVINNDESSYVLAMSDNEKRRLVLDIPRIKFSEGSVGVDGENTDLILPLTYRALRHSALNYQAKICSFPFV